MSYMMKCSQCGVTGEMDQYVAELQCPQCGGMMYPAAADDGKKKFSLGNKGAGKKKLTLSGSAANKKVTFGHKNGGSEGGLHFKPHGTAAAAQEQAPTPQVVSAAPVPVPVQTVQTSLVQPAYATQQQAQELPPVPIVPSQIIQQSAIMTQQQEDELRRQQEEYRLQQEAAMAAAAAATAVNPAPVMAASAAAPAVNPAPAMPDSSSILLAQQKVQMAAMAQELKDAKQMLEMERIQMNNERQMMSQQLAELNDLRIKAGEFAKTKAALELADAKHQQEMEMERLRREKEDFERQTKEAEEKRKLEQELADAKKAEQSAADARQKAEKDLEAARQEKDSMKKDLEDAKKSLESAKKDLETAKKDLEAAKKSAVSAKPEEKKPEAKGETKAESKPGDPKPEVVKKDDDKKSDDAKKDDDKKSDGEKKDDNKKDAKDGVKKPAYAKKYAPAGAKKEGDPDKKNAAQQMQEMMNDPAYQEMIRKKKMQVNIIFTAVCTVVVILIVAMIVGIKSCNKPARKNHVKQSEEQKRNKKEKTASKKDNTETAADPASAEDLYSTKRDESGRDKAYEEFKTDYNKYYKKYISNNKSACTKEALDVLTELYAKYENYGSRVYEKNRADFENEFYQIEKRITVVKRELGVK